MASHWLHPTAEPAPPAYASIGQSDPSLIRKRSFLRRTPISLRRWQRFREASAKLESFPNKKGGDLAAWISIRQESWEGVLPVSGKIPPWLNGTYLRNGPGIWPIGDREEPGHLFDGFGTLVRLHFDSGRLTAAHRQIQSDAYREAKKIGRICYPEYSQGPRFLQLLLRLFTGGHFLTDNANNGVVRLGDGRVVCLTETVAGSIAIDPSTLGTLGRIEYEDEVGGWIQCPHPVVWENELLWVYPDFVRAGYRVGRIEAGTNRRQVIGRVECSGGPVPGWIHSFPVTEHYVVVPEMQLRYDVLTLLRSQPRPLKWCPDSGSYMHVMCRASGTIVATVKVPPFMTCHFINAYEEQDGEGRTIAIIADCCEHNGDPTTVLETLSLNSLRSFAGQDVLPDARVGRFRIPLDGTIGDLSSAIDPEAHGWGMDMCSINPKNLGRPYRYLYACGAHRPCNFPNTLTKIDLKEKTVKTWHEEGTVPSEPFFVARPGATEEDDGTVISVVSCEDGEGYAVLLDGSSFEELARGKLPYGLPYGFHGCWVPPIGQTVV